MTFHHLMFFLHTTGVVLWGGGLAFCYLCLQPATAAWSQQQRIRLWYALLPYYMKIVYWAIAMILFSGFAMLYGEGLRPAPFAWSAMTVTGLVMVILHILLWAAPLQQFQQAVDAGNMNLAEGALRQIIRMLGFSLGLGLITVIFATLGLGLQS